MIRLFLMSCLAWLSCQGALYAQDQRTDMRNDVRIGVLAYRGSENLQQNWTSLQDYLNAVLYEWSFQIVPMTLGSASKQIETGQLEFVITNPGHFVELSRTHRMSVLASRSQKKSDGTYSGEFGSAIIARRGGDIKGLQDIAGKSVMAIDQNAFGGFQLAWRECKRANLDLFEDVSELN
ncbi:MAG: PhnD/SsuA/transferrin family substrate-binding protein, partial [Hyphomicrobiales bacterium]